MSILPWQNYHFFFSFFQAAEPCPRPIHVLRRPKGLQFVSLIGGREIYIYIFFFFRGANKNGGTDRMRVGHAREERYAHGAEATTLELALVFSYARELSSSRLSLIMRRTSLKEKKNKTKNVQPGSTCLALLLQYELKSSVTTRFTNYESSNLSCNKSCCGRLWKFVAGS